MQKTKDQTSSSMRQIIFKKDKECSKDVAASMIELNHALKLFHLPETWFSNSKAEA